MTTGSTCDNKACRSDKPVILFDSVFSNVSLMYFIFIDCCVQQKGVG